MILLTIFTGALAVVFFLVLTAGLVKISGVLRSIGGTPTSYLAKLRLGLRAIERETGHLTPQLVELNGTLGEVAAGLDSIDQHLVGTIGAVQKQEG